MSVIEFRLPDVGEGIAEAEVLEWLVDVGQNVEQNDALVVIQTDKASLELPSPATGVVTKLAAEPGQVVPIGAPLVVLEGAGDEDVTIGGAHGTKPSAATEAAVGPAMHTSSRVLASPVVRKLARELGVDISHVQPGADGRVTRAAVEAVAGSESTVAETADAARASSQHEGDRAEPLRGLRRRIAETMTRSWVEIPHITEFREIPAPSLLDARARLREHLGEEEHLTLLPLLVTAVCAALREHRRFNASLDMEAGQITYRDRVGIGIATASQDGLVVPVVRDADRKGLAEIAREIRTLAEAVRDKSISLAQLQGGTFTISNFGSFGTWLGTPIIRPGEVGIVGFGRVRQSVVPVDGTPAVIDVLPVAVSTDHRLNDGQHLAAFTDSLERYLMDPVLLLARD